MKHDLSARGHKHTQKFHTEIRIDSNCTFGDNLDLQFFFVC
jgi:hypothetical protein